MKVSPGQHPECGEKGNEVRYQEPLEGRFGLRGGETQPRKAVQWGPACLTGMWLGRAVPSTCSGLRGEGRHSRWTNWTVPPDPWAGQEGLRGRVTWLVSLAQRAGGQNGR